MLCGDLYAKNLVYATLDHSNLTDLLTYKIPIELDA
jgi:hypothetical protein